MIKWFSRSIFLGVFIILFTFQIPIVRANTGFLGGPMWMNPETPKDGEFVNLSALFHNAEPNALSGDVLFYDGNVLLGTKSITIPSGGVGTATVSFRISAGDHSFSATTGNLVEALGNGKTEPFVLSPQTVQLPTISISPKAGNSLNASVVSGTTNLVTNNIFPPNQIAKQVNELGGNVISSIPDSVKNPAVDTASSVDSWRTKTADSLTKQTKAASVSANKANELVSAQEKKYGKASFLTKFIDRPFAYVKLFFMQLLTFLWSHAIVFYLLIALIVYACIRFLYKKIRGRRDTSTPPIKKQKR
ncbi:MAG: Ig-like domain-containing protein [bacterium]